MKSPTMGSNSLYKKLGCDVHEELKCLKFIQHFSWAAHDSAVKQAVVGGAPPPFHPQGNRCIRFMYLRPWKTEGSFMAGSPLPLRYKN